LILLACQAAEPPERYGFIARLGNDTISIESVTRTGNRLVTDEVDRFPRVRRRHTTIDLAPDGSIRRLEMVIRTPSEPEPQRERRVTAEVRGDSVHITKRDSGTVTRAFPTGGRLMMPHLPQMYSLIDLYIGAALRQAADSSLGPGKEVRLHQYYIDREFDRFPRHEGVVTLGAPGKAQLRHDWLAGTADATFDSLHRMLTYNGAGTTYHVDVRRIAEVPDIEAIGERFAAQETAAGGMRQLSVRDTARAAIGAASFTVDYSRPLARGRVLLGNIIAYDRVWRTGANAATQFTTSSPITLAGLNLPAGKYTLWTVPRADGRADLIVNSQVGQWGTGYDGRADLGRVAMVVDTLTTPVDKFTIAIAPAAARRGDLVMEWGTFRWRAGIQVR
jgi:hypothetical protein